jgi:protein phosphatase
MRIEVVGLSHPGRRRESNEDCFAIGPFIENRRPIAVTFHTDGLQAVEYGMFVAVADGMGGHAAGFAASRSALQAMVRMYYGELRRDADPEELAEGLGLMVERTHRLLVGLGAEDPGLRGMGTTLCGFVVWGEHCSTFNVGDSRLYRFRHGHLDRLTRDDAVVVREEERLGARRSRGGPSVSRHALTKVLGGQRSGPVHPEVRANVPLARGDLLLLCTDGLHGSVSEQGLFDILGSSLPLERKARQLVARANAAGGPDNVTVVLAQARD